MLGPRLVRTFPGLVALLAVGTLAACGGEAPVDAAAPTTKVDPSGAEAILRQYIDENDCSLLSDDIAITISPDADDGRKQCAAGALPVDALLRPGQYKITSAEIIDDQGLFTVKVNDGGAREYTLVKSGDAGWQIQSVAINTTTKIGKPLLLQAREQDGDPAIDARVTVKRLIRIPRKKLSVDEFTSINEDYYKIKVAVTSRSRKPIAVGAFDFTLADATGNKLAAARPAFTSVGGILDPVVEPGATNTGYVFFSSPAGGKVGQVRYTAGTDDTGATLVWKTR